MSSITAILVSYNSEAVVVSAITALINHPNIIEIMMVDNCSTDNSIEVVQAKFPSVRIIENPTNEGFGRANNIALGKTKTEFALLVNPDAVLQEGAVETLLAAAALYPDAAILSPQLKDEHGKVHKSFKQSVFKREKNKAHFIEPVADLCAEYLSGAVMLLRVSVFKQIGFFDRNIFLYYEDDELCLRARKSGYACVLVHAAWAVHLMGASSGTANAKNEFIKQRHMLWSRLYVQEKYKGRASAIALGKKLQREYALKCAWYTLSFNTLKIARYRGRIQGIVGFTEPGTIR